MIEEDVLDRAIRLTKVYSRLEEDYPGLISVSKDKVHLTTEEFLERFADYTIVKVNSYEYPFWLSTTKDGVVVMCLANDKQMCELKNTVKNLKERFVNA